MLVHRSEDFIGLSAYSGVPFRGIRPPSWPHNLSSDQGEIVSSANLGMLTFHMLTVYQIPSSYTKVLLDRKII